jgi:hypothetical protein
VTEDKPKGKVRGKIKKLAHSWWWLKPQLPNLYFSFRNNLEEN